MPKECLGFGTPILHINTLTGTNFDCAGDFVVVDQRILPSNGDFADWTLSAEKPITSEPLQARAEDRALELRGRMLTKHRPATVSSEAEVSTGLGLIQAGTHIKVFAVEPRAVVSHSR